jgi:hypothetical protein
MRDPTYLALGHSPYISLGRVDGLVEDDEIGPR